MDVAKQHNILQNKWKINKKFLYCSIYKSQYTRSIWQKLINFINKEINFTPLDFYIVLSTSMIDYLFQWRYYKLEQYRLYIGKYIQTETEKSLKYKYSINDIVNHFVHLIVSIICTSNSFEATRISTDLLKLLQYEEISNKITKRDILKCIVRDDVEKFSNIDFFDDDDGIRYFDGVGTILWLWIHLTAARINKIIDNFTNITLLKTEFYMFFDYLKYFLWCPTCFNHYIYNVYPLLDKLDKTNVLLFTIDIHNLVNKRIHLQSTFNINELETDEQQTTNKQSDFYDSYMDFWNDSK